MPILKDESVDLSRLVPELGARLWHLDQVHLETIGRLAVITSGSEGRRGDGIHSTGSLHYDGRAVDVRTRDLSHREAARLALSITDEFGSDFDVVSEGDHIHIEYDP